MVAVTLFIVLCHLKKLEKKGKQLDVFIEFVTLAFLFITLALFTCGLEEHLVPFLYSSMSSLVLLLSAAFHAIGPTVQCVPIISHNCFLSQLKEERRRIMHLYHLFIIA